MTTSPDSRNQSRAYLIDGRLEDVLALIQVLALAPEIQRSEKSLQSALLTTPQSSDSWISIAQVHCELFRVYPSTGSDGSLASLVARRLLPPDDRKALPPELVTGMIEAAIRIHDTQLQRRQVLKVAWAGGTFLALSTLASLISALASLVKP